MVNSKLLASMTSMIYNIGGTILSICVTQYEQLFQLYLEYVYISGLFVELEPATRPVGGQKTIL